MTKKQKLLRILKTGKAFTTGDLDAMLATNRTGGLIGQLRADGHEIKTDLVPRFDRNGNPCRIALYTLVKEASA